MDSEAHHAERDRSRPRFPHAPSDVSPDARSDGGDGARRSRSARVFPGSPRGRLSRGIDRLPGKGLTAGLLLCVLAVLLVGRFVMQPYGIPSGSMQPGLRVGDRVLVNKLAYRFGAQPQRGDVVVFDGTGYFGGADYIKRVVGVGGDHVVCCDSQGRIEVNGDPVRENGYLYPGDAPSDVPFDVRVPTGTLFLLGDHRSGSSDSRDRLGAPGGGMVPVSAVIGKAEWVAWPPGHWTDVGLGDVRHGDVRQGDVRQGERSAGGAGAVSSEGVDSQNAPSQDQVARGTAAGGQAPPASSAIPPGGPRG